MIGRNQLTFLPHCLFCIVFSLYLKTLSGLQNRQTKERGITKRFGKLADKKWGKMFEKHDRIMTELFAQQHLRAIKFEGLKMSEDAIRQELSLRRCSMLSDLVILQDRLIRSIFREDAKIAKTTATNKTRTTGFSDPNNCARINVEIHLLNVHDQNAMVVSSAVNSPDEQVFVEEVAGARPYLAIVTCV